jgi:hypothetical protein
VFAMSDPRLRPAYWFPAKTYGWGWGLPCRWQGWVVMVLYLAGLVAAALVFLPKEGTPRTDLFGISVAALSAVLIAICWWKGERPAWRWGVPKK